MFTSLHGDEMGNGFSGFQIVYWYYHPSPPVDIEHSFSGQLATKLEVFDERVDYEFHGRSIVVKYFHSNYKPCRFKSFT